MSRQLTIRQAAAVQFASKYSNAAVLLVVAMVLARLVTPEEFGLVAIVTVFTNFFALLCDMGLSAGIVQHKELSEKDLSGLFLFSSCLAVVLAAAFALLALCVDLARGATASGAALAPLFLASSPGVFFAALNTVPTGVLRLRKRFFAMGVRQVAVNLASGCVAVAMAFAGAGCYALIVQFTLSSALTFACNFVLAGLHIQHAPILSPVRALWGFSSFQLGHGFINYFSNNMDNLLVGIAFGNAQLGFYDKAYQLSRYPVVGFTSVVESVLHPYLSDRRNHPEEIYERFARLTQGTFCIGILVSTCLVAAPAELIDVLFGEQWGEAAPVLCVLGICVASKMCTSMTGAVFQSLGATRDMFLSTVMNTALTLIAIGLGVASGNLMALAACVSVSYCLNPIATYYFLIARAFGRPLGRFAHTMAPQLAVAVGMIACGGLVHAGFGAFAASGAAELGSLAVLAVKVCVCCGAYALVLGVTGQWQHLRVLFGKTPKAFSS